MSFSRPRPLVSSVLPAVLVWLILTAAVRADAGEAAVATVHPWATIAAVEALEQGGNAVDAAVAAGLMLGVVDNHNSGIGGGCFVLIRTADGRFAAIDGRETAPATATRDMFLEDGVPRGDWSRTGPLASGVPGALAAYAHAVEHYGRLPLSVPLLRAADRAEQGFAVDRVYARNLQSTATDLRRFEGSRDVFFKTGDQVWEEGDWLVQGDLARTYRSIAEQGTSWFYEGPFALATARWMSENGGLLTVEDFAAYEPLERMPIVSRYRDLTIVGFPPPSSGGVHIAQMLNMLEPFSLQERVQQDSAQADHLIVEVMKRAFADRAHWLGDPDHVPVPRGLIDRGYAADLRRSIDPDRATVVESHGSPPRATTDLFDRHTTHIAVVDHLGNWVGITQTVNTSFGSKVVIPETGVVLNNEMDDFAIHPGVPNAFGLIGAEANAVAPGKRPLSSMSPTIVLRDGEPIMTVGAAGGPRIITQVLLAVVRHFDYGLPLEEALGRPRFHHQWSPDRLFLERGFDESRRESLVARGHNVVVATSAGVCQAIVRLPDGRLVPMHDPRVPGSAMVVELEPAGTP